MFYFANNWQNETLLVYMGLKWEIILLISALIISSISLIFPVVWDSVHGTTQQGKCNSKDQKGRRLTP